MREGGREGGIEGSDCSECEPLYLGGVACHCSDGVAHLYRYHSYAVACHWRVVPVARSLAREYTKSWQLTGCYCPRSVRVDLTSPPSRRNPVVRSCVPPVRVSDLRPFRVRARVRCTAP